MTDQRGILIGGVASILSSKQFNNKFFEYGNRIYELATWRFDVLINDGPRIANNKNVKEG
jgi:hypothetical protein